MRRPLGKVGIMNSNEMYGSPSDYHASVKVGAGGTALNDATPASD